MRVEQEVKAPTQVSKADFLDDWAKGFCVIEYSPACVRELRDRRCPGITVKVNAPQILTLRCMRCQFDVSDQSYGKAGEGRELMGKHLEMNVHPWAYGIFKNPYGHIADVTIEGLDPHKYDEEIKCL